MSLTPAGLDVYRVGELPEQRRSRFGAKAVGLDRLVRSGFRVPHAVVVPIEAYWAWRLAPEVCLTLADRAIAALSQPESSAHSLVSVRSGSSFSMPGQLLTLLNVGAESADFIRLHATAPAFWERVAIMTAQEERFPVGQGKDAITAILTGQFHPRRRLHQIASAMNEVFTSSGRAAAAAAAFMGVELDPGTSCVIQVMVHGDIDEASGAGVASSCDPLTGAQTLTGSFVWSGIGREIVDGRASGEYPILELMTRAPDAYAELVEATKAIACEERHPVEIEFVVERGVLWILQARRAALTRPGLAAVVLRRLQSGDETLASVARTWLAGAGPAVTASDPPAERVPVIEARGTPASAGVAEGPLVWPREGIEPAKGAIIACDRLDAARDFTLIKRAGGLVTTRGGASSHVAALCRKLGKPYICHVPWASLESSTASRPFAEGDQIWLDGSTGALGLGRPPARSLAPTAAEVELDTRVTHFRRRTWFAAHRQHERDVEMMVASSSRLLAESPWKTRKARVIELSSLLPLSRRIPAVVVSASDPAAIRDAMLDGISNGYAIGPKCSFLGVPRLGTGMWQSGLVAEADVEAFLNDPDYLGPSGHGGYRSWIRDRDLSELILMLDPLAKHPDTPRNQRFVACLSIAPTRQFAHVDLLMNTWRLRDFEDASPEDIARISVPLDNLAINDRNIFVSLGSRWLKRPVAGHGRSASLLLEQRDGLQVADPLVRDAIDDRGTSIIATVADALFGTWWTDAKGLPVAMDVLECVASLDAVEFQGRCGSEGEDFFLLFDLKGGEEERAAATSGAAIVK